MTEPSWVDLIQGLARDLGLATDTDPLTGVAPTWRPTEEPIYLQLVAEYGVPGMLTGPAGSVLVGEVA